MIIKHHFFGKDCVIDRELTKRANLASALKNQGFNSEHVLFVNQVHGNLVVTIDTKEKIHGEQGLPKADALVTNLPNIIIGVITADCAPILLFDKEKKIIAAAHAGWRGARLGVIASTVVEMKRLGAEKISAIIGPMIQQKSYEVSQEVFDDFFSEDPRNVTFFVHGGQPQKYWFDLNSYVEKKLRDAEVLEIRNDKIDTYVDEKNLFSFRRSTHREEKDCGRNVSVISLG